MPGDFTDWEDCVQYAPNIKNNPSFCGFERDVLDMWINYFFIKPELMNIAGKSRKTLIQTLTRTLSI